MGGGFYAFVLRNLVKEDPSYGCYFKTDSSRSEGGGGDSMPVTQTPQLGQKGPGETVLGSVSKIMCRALVPPNFNNLAPTVLYLVLFLQFNEKNNCEFHRTFPYYFVSCPVFCN